MQVRFDNRQILNTTSGSSIRKRHRTITTIACGSKAFGNKEMRAIFGMGKKSK